MAFQQTAKHRKYFFDKQPTTTSTSTPEILLDTSSLNAETNVTKGKKKNKLTTIWKKKDDSLSGSIEDTIRSKFKRNTNTSPAKHENKRDDSLYNLIEFLDKSLETQLHKPISKQSEKSFSEQPTSPRVRFFNFKCLWIFY